MSDDLPQFSPEIIDRLVKETMPFGYIIWDAQGNGIDCSADVVRLFGLSTPQEVFDHWNDLSPPFQPDGHSSGIYFNEVVSRTNINETVVFEWQHQSVDGTLIPLEVTSVRHSFEGNDVFVVYLRDQRNSQQAQCEWDIGQSRLTGILRSCPICFALLSNDQFTFVTPFMGNFLGVKVGDTFSSLLDNPEMVEELRKEASENDLVSWIPVTIKTRFGETKEMLAYSISFDESEAERIVWLIDVTQSRRLERELTFSKEQAEASTKTKSEFLANMSHEIRTPMNAIIGFTHLALLTPLTEQQKQYIETTQQSAHFLLQLINDILDFSKIEAGRMILEYREFSIGSVISDVTAIVSVKVQEKNLKLQVEVGEGLPKAVMGDSVRLHQVILNLLTNAVKFTEKGEIRVNVEVVELDMLSVVVRFSVTDQGIGMTPIQVQGLFQPFAQATAATTRQFGGTGLGLAIAKKIVESMHGEISCQSERGKGTTFTFTARFGIPLEGEVVTVDETTEIRTDALLVGDCDHEQMVMQHYIELLGAKVYRTGASPAKFKELIDTGKIENVDFIIFDIADLRKDFVPIYTMLCGAHLESLPVCAITDHPELETVLDELNIKDSVHVLAKPVIAGDLFNVLSMTANRKKELLQMQKTLDSSILPLGQPNPVISKSVRGAKILLAEDNKVNQMVAMELLKLEGFEVTIANNGRIAIELLQEQQFDLILMDLQMPEMDGFGAARAIRSDSRFAEIPILAMTASAMSSDREACLEAGMNDHIPKPIEPKVLYSTLVKWLQKKERGTKSPIATPVKSR